jgi:hypothetical protein
MPTNCHNTLLPVATKTVYPIILFKLKCPDVTQSGRCYSFGIQTGVVHRITYVIPLLLVAVLTQFILNNLTQAS